MRMYFSGGSAIAETSLRNPSADIMLSYFVDVNTSGTKPNKRMATIFKVRNEKRKGKKGKGKKRKGKRGTGK